MDFQVGDILGFKKQHPCGSKQWRIIRTGADFRLECCGCKHQLMMSRSNVVKNTKEIQKKLEN